VQGDCAFCQIAAGALTASIVLDDPTVLAFMDLRQFNPGHVLVIPRRHIPTILELDEATGAELMVAVIRVAQAVSRAFQPDGINITQSNGEAAGQEIFHVHFHIHTRRAGDGMMYYPPAQATEPEELDRYAERIRRALRGED
jgi:histidine triad (HIT) family protein